MRLEFLEQVLEKLLIVKFHENPSVGNGVVPCVKKYRQTDRQIETDLTKLTLAFRISANEPNTTKTA